jgi:hypothetical protein
MKKLTLKNWTKYEKNIFLEIVSILKFFKIITRTNDYEKKLITTQHW